jgi:hypothetical protein
MYDPFRARSDRGVTSTPVILLTGWGPQCHDDAAVMPDVDLRLSKPARLAVLQAALARVTEAAAVARRPGP